MSQKRQAGFTLIELMITVVIVAILASVAYPSYIQYVVRANRSAAQSFMYAVANKQEQYMLDARMYAGGSSVLTDLGITPAADVGGKYDFSVTCTMPSSAGACTVAAGAPSYVITATPKAGSAQARNDTACAVLSLDSLGVKTAKNQAGALVNASTCW